MTGYVEIESAKTADAYAAKVVTQQRERHELIEWYKAERKYTDWVEVHPGLVLLAERCLKLTEALESIGIALAKVGDSRASGEEPNSGLRKP